MYGDRYYGAMPIVVPIMNKKWFGLICKVVIIDHITIKKSGKKYIIKLIKREMERGRYIFNSNLVVINNQL